MASNIYLIGPLGAGKTAVGRYLSKKMNRLFFDTDHELVKRAGADLNWIYDIEGEAGYRRREKQVIENLSQKDALVISTGGGAVLTSENGRIMKASGMIIYLSVSYEIQLQRTQLRRGTRPLLEDCTSFKDNLHKLNAERTPLYEALADYTLSTDHETAFKLASKIRQYLLEKNI
jgi:shikimate kinase